MANITKAEWEVLMNILGAVETGGQVYGQRNYAAYEGAYTNSSAEDSLTIGAYQEFSGLAKGLLQDIKDQYPDVFAKYDNAGIADDLRQSSWTGYSPSPNSAKAKAIINIISTPQGKQVQDERFIEQMKEHIAYAESLGVTDIEALAMSINYIHQGGMGALKRIIAKTPRPYTLDNLYNASKSDTGNQVGAYRTRQTAVYNMIKQYLPVSTHAEHTDDLVATENVDESMPTPIEHIVNSGIKAEDILNIMRSWIGLNQYDGSHMQIVNIYNSHKPLARNYALNSADSWCACTVSTAFIKANATDLIGGTECGVERFVEDCFKPAGIWIEDENITPLPGDIICFNWGGTHPNTGWADHIGIVEYVEGSVIHTIEGNSGGYCRRKTYPIGYNEIRGFARPKYGADSSTTLINSGSTAVPKTGNSTAEGLRKGSSGEEVAAMQSMLITCGYNCGGYGADGDFGEATHDSLVQFQQDHGLAANGVYDDATKATLRQAFADAPNEEAFPKTMYTVKNPYSYLREGPAKTKPIIGKLGVGMKVKATKSHVNKAGNLWYKVTVSGVKGWIVGTSLSENKP